MFRSQNNVSVKEVDENNCFLFQHPHVNFFCLHGFLLCFLIKRYSWHNIISNILHLGLRLYTQKLFSGKIQLKNIFVQPVYVLNYARKHF
jgi:hypothetical protein